MPTLRVAAYIRVSTRRQVEHGLSLDDQLRAIKTKTTQLGGELVAVFEEKGVSGTDGDRPEFRRLMATALSADRPFDMVMVHTTSRFARDLIVSESNVRDLEKARIAFVSATQEVGEPLTRAMMAIVDEMHSRQNSQKVGEMMQANAEAGFWNGGPAPFGYRTHVAERRGKKDKKILVIDDVEAAVIRRMFELCIKGNGSTGPMGIKAIVNHLNLSGEKTRTGHEWQLSTVHGKLTSTYYDGYYLRTRGSRSKTRSVDDGHQTRIACPRLVDESTYQAVQAKLKRDNPFNMSPRIASADHLLTGIAICQTCGTGLTITTGKSGRYRYYSCRGSLTKGRLVCDAPTRVPVDELNDTVLDALMHELTEEHRLHAILKGLSERRDKENESLMDELIQLERTALENQRSVQNLLQLVERGLIDLEDADFAVRFEAAKTKRNISDSALRRARERAGIAKSITSEMVVSLAALLKTGLSTGNAKFKRSYINVLVDQIKITDEDVVIRGKASNILTAAETGATATEVPMRIQEWRARRDSNS